MAGIFRGGGPWLGQMLLKVVEWGTYDDAKELLTQDVVEAHVATSLIAGQEVGEYARHRVVLDIDMEAELIPSSTPGHYHLYLDHELSWRQYRRLLVALAEAGIVEEGYVGASERRGFTCVRLPWVKKGLSLSAEHSPATGPDERAPF